MKRYSQYGKVIIQKDGSRYPSGLPFVDFVYPGVIDLHQVDLSESSRPDILAWKLLKDASLWPILGWMNNVIDPLVGFANLITDLETGVIQPNLIMYPSDSARAQTSVVPFTYQQDKNG